MVKVIWSCTWRITRIMLVTTSTIWPMHRSWLTTIGVTSYMPTQCKSKLEIRFVDKIKNTKGVIQTKRKCKSMLIRLKLPWMLSNNLFHFWSLQLNNIYKICKKITQSAHSISTSKSVQTVIMLNLLSLMET